MKNLKISLTLVLLLSLIFVGCNDEEQEDLWYSYGTYVETDENSNGFEIKLDDGSQLIPLSVDFVGNDVTENSRVFVLYSINTKTDSTVNANVKEVSEILTKGVLQLTEENEDSIGNDGIIVYEDDLWFSQNHFNVMFSYYGYGTIHFINLVKPLGDQTDEDGRQILEFRHNANGDYPGRYVNSVVSFDMWSLHEDGMDSINFVFRSVDYNNIDFSWEGTFYFNDSIKIKNMVRGGEVNFETVY